MPRINQSPASSGRRFPFLFKVTPKSLFLPHRSLPAVSCSEYYLECRYKRRLSDRLKIRFITYKEEKSKKQNATKTKRIFLLFVFTYYFCFGWWLVRLISILSTELSVRKSFLDVFQSTSSLSRLFKTSWLVEYWLRITTDYYYLHYNDCACLYFVLARLISRRTFLTVKN